MVKWVWQRGEYCLVYMCVRVCVFIWASLLHTHHSSVSVLTCLTGLFYCVCRDPRTHSRISAPHRNPLELHLVSSDTPTVHNPPIQNRKPCHLQWKAMKGAPARTGFKPCLTLIPWESELDSFSLYFSPTDLNQGVTDLPLSFILHHINVWPNSTQEWALQIHVRAWKDAVCFWRN